MKRRAARKAASSVDANSLAAGAPAQSRVPRRWIIGFAILALLWLAGLVFLKLQSQGGYRPTGDELFDRYARLVLSQQHKFRNEPWLHRTLAGLGIKLPISAAQPEALDFAVLREWEAEFGDDPRYWELRAACSMDIGADTIPQMREKMLTGVASSGMLMQVGIGPMLNDEPHRAMQLVEQVIAAEPDNSYAYYVKGDLLLEQGDQTGALAAYTAGNEAKDNRMPLAFPMSIIAEQPTRFTTPDERLVAGYTWCAYELVVLPDVKTIHERGEALARAASSPADTALANVYWMRVCRFGQMVNQTPFSNALAANVLRKMLDAYSNAEEKSERQETECAEMYACLQGVRANLQPKSHPTLSEGGSYQGFGQYTRDDVQGGLADYLAWQEVIEANRAELRSLETPPFGAWNAGETAGYKELITSGSEPDAQAVPQSAP